MNDTRIRKAVAGDEGRFFDICRMTAAAGQDASAEYSSPRLPGLIWAVPYLRFQPDCAFVLEAEGQAVGYVIGTPDSAGFAARLEAEWWPAVRREVAGLVPARARDAGALERISGPSQKDDGLLAGYPAHMHINILPGRQGGGWGRRMIETQLGNLRALGVTGVHLGVDPANARAAGFYRHLGFEDVSPEGQLVFGMRL